MVVLSVANKNKAEKGERGEAREEAVTSGHLWLHFKGSAAGLG